MFKRFLAVLLGVLVCAGVFAGCQFIERDAKVDLGQIVATVASVEDPAFEGGASGERNIYKYELVDAIGQQFAEATAAPTEEQIDEVLQSLVEREVLYVEIERMIKSGELRFRDGGTEYEDPDRDGVKYRDYTDANNIVRLRYDWLDEQLRAEQKTLLGGDAPADSEPPEEPAPTYPVRESEEEEVEAREETPFDILTDDPSRIPGEFGGAEQISLEKRALSGIAMRLITMIREDSYLPLTNDDETKLTAAETGFRALIDAGKYRELYLGLADSFPVKFLIGKNTERQVWSGILQKHLVDGITVGETEVAARYNALLNTQKMDYQNPETYATAVSGTDTILYRPSGDYLYVKHILLPFSEAQTAKLTAKKAEPNVTKAQVLEFRDRMVNEILVYPHPEGNDIISGRTTVKAAFNEIYAAVSGAYIEDKPKAAERKFDDYIYLYNTDPGAFTSTAGYAVNKAFDPANRTFMEEFEKGAEELLKNYQPGDVLPKPVVTDYGVHIMYYASNTQANSVKQLYDYETSAEYKTIYKVLEEGIRTTREGERVNKWTSERVDVLTKRDNYAETFKNRYDDLIDLYTA